MSTDLKPCPFCGSVAIVWMQAGHAHYLECSHCGGRIRPHIDKAEAIEAWNRAMGAKDINVPNKGKWQRRKGSDCWECSECHAVLESDDIVRHNYYYCYHCGADMMSEDGYMKLEGTEHE